MRLKDWIKSIGGVPVAARKIGAVESGVRHWVGGVRPVPANRVLTISAASGWVVTPHEIRPDLYPYPSDGLPPDRRDSDQERAA
jgi:DNA-binding transcriptional regulator YdaS (Cro superfamily)